MARKRQAAAADIFYNNCFKNGLLPIKLAEEQVQEIFERFAKHAGYELTVDLEKCVVSDNYGLHYSFEVNDSRRHCMLNGLDDIAQTLKHADKITAYEAARGMTAVT